MGVSLSVWLAALAGGAVAGFFVLLLSRVPDRAPSGSRLGPAANDYALLLNQGRVRDASEGARLFHRTLQGEIPDTWAELRGMLEPALGELPETPEPGRIRLEGIRGGDPAFLEVSRAGSCLRVRIACEGTGSADRLISLIAEGQIVRFRQMLEIAPGPIWVQDADGNLAWHNAAFGALSREGTKIPNFASGSDGTPRTERLSLPSPDDGRDRWFEVTSLQVGGDTMHFATNVDAVVRAEIAQRNFVQTLTKTFAHLPTGLAVFDRNRQLALFNPALIDLTSLPAEFLAARPSIMTFFDQLREARMMPEPKNYATWREQIVDLVRATCDDRFAETWTLPSGLTYRITGRPHPDGAIAFLIEDISAEISLTRRFRTELLQLQAVIDAMPDAVVVFAANGAVTACNRAYRTLWGGNGGGESGLGEECDRWMEACESHKILTDVRTAVASRNADRFTPVELHHASAGRLRCSLLALSGGGTMVRFERLVGPPASPGASERSGDRAAPVVRAS